MPSPALVLLFTLALPAAETGNVPVGTLSGWVRTADGTPVSGMLVELIEGKKHQLLPEVTTDSRGRYRLDGLLPGRYTGWMRLGASSIRPFELHIAPGDNRRDVTLEWSVVRGRVLSDGAPVAGAIVRLLYAGTQNRELTSGEDGSFAFLVTPISYQLTASQTGYRTPRPAQALEVPTGSLIEVDLHLDRTACLRGHLLGLTPEDLAGATIEVERGQGEARVSARVAEDGSYEVGGLTPGTWWVRASAHPKHAAAKVVLGEAEERLLDLPFSYRRVSGHAVDGEGQLLADRKLTFRWAGVEASTRTLADGSFALELPDGYYDVVEKGAGDGEPLSTAELTVDGSLPKNLELRLVAATLDPILPMDPPDAHELHLAEELIRLFQERKP